ncbi:uncharacterized protein UBRO_07930 [Ustilago bromivora]|uniref:EamA domain-containing protein n=1 Tax=Ustilago bromivora TaxID=307758 RepID=A0A1K0HC82_9BASI|nr:uncharacterized protein UBRO_07930 [Ustilago bromivora]
MSANIFRDSYAGQRNEDHASATRRPKKASFMNLPGGGKAIAAFVSSLFAYTLQTEFAQYVQQSLNYRKPFLSLYLGHSGFLLLFPLHLYFLKWTTKRPITHYLHLIAQNLRWQLETPTSTLPDPRADAVRHRLSKASGRGSRAVSAVDARDREPESLGRRRISALEQEFGFNVLRLAGLFLVLTVGITIPALSWYCAVPMTSMADITAIYNTFSVWALVFSVWFLGEKWEKRKVFSVLLACLGVVIVAYGGADHRKLPKPIDPVHRKPPTSGDPAGEVVRRSIQALLSRLLRKREADAEPPVSSAHNPVLGDMLAFIGAVTMAAFEMAFKLIGTLPDEQKQAEMYSAVPGGRNRRSRSYVRYQDTDEDCRQPGHESEGLLRNSTSEGHRSGFNADIGALSHDDTESRQHVLGGHDDDDDKRRVSSDARTYSTVVDKLIEQDHLDYQSITPPLEPSTSFDDKQEAKADEVRVHAKAVRVSNGAKDNRDEDGESQVTESELDEEEEQLVLSGATRLHRTRSHLSTSHLASTYADDSLEDPLSAGPAPGLSRRTSSYRKVSDPSIPPPLPFGLHANVMTAGIGVTTFTTFWVGIIIAHQLGWETFELPHNLRTYVSTAMVVLCGIFFNAAFMILLSLWGPVLASVSCLMTTILVEIADVLLGHKLKWISVLGCTFIGAGFAVLVGGGDAMH